MQELQLLTAAAQVPRSTHMQCPAHPPCLHQARGKRSKRAAHHPQVHPTLMCTTHHPQLQQQVHQGQQAEGGAHAKLCTLPYQMSEWALTHSSSTVDHLGQMTQGLHHCNCHT